MNKMITNTPTQDTLLADADIRFLMTEYDRLKGLESGLWDTYFSRFNFFMTVTLALIAAYVTLASASSPALPISSPIPELLGGVILVWGVFTFVGLVELSYGIRHMVNAMIDIQGYFTERNPNLKRYLYFTNPDLYKMPGKLEYLGARYVFRGSPKLILAVLNSALVALFAEALLVRSGLLYWLALLLTGAIFLLVGALHAVYVWFIYRRKYLA